MKSRLVLIFGCLVLPLVVVGVSKRAAAQKPQPLTRIAEIEIDPTQVEQYKAALREGIEAAIRLEPGVLSLYAVSVKDHPEQVRVFEVYADAATYQRHLQTAHFKKYKAVTQGMVRSLKLLDTEPIALKTKPAFAQ